MRGGPSHAHESRCAFAFALHYNKACLLCHNASSASSMKHCDQIISKKEIVIK